VPWDGNNIISVLEQAQAWWLAVPLSHARRDDIKHIRAFMDAGIREPA